MIFKKPERVEEESPLHQISANCLDCDWQDDVSKAETDWCGDFDEFKGINVPTKVCPRCGGGVEMN